MNKVFILTVLIFIFTISLIEGNNGETNDNSYDWPLSVIEMKEISDSYLIELNQTGEIIIYKIFLLYGDNGKYSAGIMCYLDVSKPLDNTTIIKIEVNDGLEGEVGLNQIKKEINMNSEKWSHIYNPTFNYDSDEAYEIALSYPEIQKFISNGERDGIYGLDSSTWVIWKYNPNEDVKMRLIYDISFQYMVYEGPRAMIDDDKSNYASVGIDVETGEVLYVSFDLEEKVEETKSHVKYYITGAFILVLLFLFVLLLRTKQKE